MASVTHRECMIVDFWKGNDAVDALRTYAHERGQTSVEFHTAAITLPNGNVGMAIYFDSPALRSVGNVSSSTIASWKEVLERHGTEFAFGIIDTREMSDIQLVGADDTKKLNDLTPQNPCHRECMIVDFWKGNDAVDALRTYAHERGQTSVEFHTAAITLPNGNVGMAIYFDSPALRSVGNVSSSTIASWKEVLERHGTEFAFGIIDTLKMSNVQLVGADDPKKLDRLAQQEWHEDQEHQSPGRRLLDRVTDSLLRRGEREIS